MLGWWCHQESATLWEVFLLPSTSTSLNTASVGVCAFTEEEKPNQVHSSATTPKHGTAKLKRHSTQYLIFFLPDLNTAKILFFLHFAIKKKSNGSKYCHQSGTGTATELNFN